MTISESKEGSFVKGCLPRAALLLAGVLFTLAVLEVAIHLIEARTGPLFFGGLANPEYNPRFVQPHPVLDVEHRSHASLRYALPEHPGGFVELRTNGQGLREDADVDVTKPEDVYRILVLGDSQTDGLVYNSESFANVLEALLNEEGPRPDGRRYEVLNAGVITYQPIHEYLWWQTYGRSYRPDLVIMGYYVGNDLVDAGGARLTRTDDGGFRLDDSPHPPPSEPRLQALLRQCRLCVLASLPLRGGPLEGLLYRLGLVHSAVEGRYIKAHRFCRGCTWQSLHQTRLLEENPKKYQADLAATEEILRRLRDEVTAIGAEFLVVVIPSKLQVEGDGSGRAAQVAEMLGMSLLNPPFEDRVERDVLEVCHRNEIAVIDLRPGLAEAFTHQGQPLYYEVDWHLNVAGNQLAGELIFQWMKD